jgi:hypothetical protein
MATATVSLALVVHLLLVVPVAGGDGGTLLPEGRKAPGPGEEKAAPGSPNVHCTSTKGPFTIEMHPEWVSGAWVSTFRPAWCLGL